MMELNVLLHILASLTVIAVTCNAALTPEQYWKSELPNIQMPQAIKDMLQQPAFIEAKSTSQPGSYNNYRQASQAHHVPNVVLFFLEKDLKPGTTMTLHFIKSPSLAGFLPREEAKAIPFSSENLPEIFGRFSVKPGSVHAKMMTETIRDCEEGGIKGEEKYCATSFESMIDYIKSKLGNDVKEVSTTLKSETQMQKFTIQAGLRRVYAADASSMVCHKQNYVYAVFYCHTTPDTRFYAVPVRGADGTEVRAIAACHSDTSAWNPKFQAFQLLKVKPGTVPICHFLREDEIVWFHN